MTVLNSCLASISSYTSSYTMLLIATIKTYSSSYIVNKVFFYLSKFNVLKKSFILSKTKLRD